MKIHPVRILRRAALLALLVIGFELALDEGLSAMAAADEAPGKWTPELALKVRRISDVQPSPNGTRATFVVGTALTDGEKSEWNTQIHVANSDGTGAFQLTRSETSSRSPRWSPDGTRIAFISQRSGKANVFVISLDGGEAEQLTDVKSGVGAIDWAPDGRSLAFLMPDPKTEADEKNEKEKRDMRVVDEDFKMSRLHVIPLERDAAGKREPRVLTKGEYNVDSFNWAPDSKTIVFSHEPTPRADDWTRADISLVSVADLAVTPIARTGASETGPVFSPDGRWIAFVATDTPPTWGGTGHVQIVAATGGTPRTLAATADEQPDILGWSADGTSIYFRETRGTINRLAMLPIDGGPPEDVKHDLSVDAAALNRRATHVGFVSSAPDRPPEAFVSPLAPFVAKQASRVNADLQLPPIGKTDVLAWTSPDGLSIEGLLTYPVGYAPGTRIPLLVIVHGGPTGVFVRSFVGGASPYPIAVFADHGFAVLRSNPRGSSGYGRRFRYANYRDWGSGDYRDIMSGVDKVIQMGVADPNRLGVMGWSYGGYMTSWIITQTKRFKAASVGAGVTNLMSFTGTSDIPGFIPDYMGGEYWDAFDTWRSHSAMFNAKGVSTPTLIEHGEADERVPVSQGYEFYNALKRQNVPVKMIIYPRQHHGFAEPKMTLDAATRNVEWFDRWILNKDRKTSSSK